MDNSFLEGRKSGKKELKVTDLAGNALALIDLDPYLQVLHESRRGEYDFWSILTQHIGVTLGEIVSCSMEYPLYKQAEAIVGIENAVADDELVEMFSTDKFDVYPVARERMEIKPDEFTEVPKDAVRLMRTQDGVPYVVCTEPYGGRMDVNVYAQSQDLASTVLDSVYQHSVKLSYRKGELIGADGGFLKLDKEYTWDDIILENGMAEDIRRNIVQMFENAEIHRKYNLPTKRGVILYGPPGTGKTQCIRVLGSQLTKDNITVIVVTAKDVMSFDASVVEKIYKCAADYAPSLVVLEDFDMYSKHRDIEGRSDILGELLDTLDGVEPNSDVITLVTTNKVETIEDALKDRPGRFDRKFNFAEPKGYMVQQLYQLFGDEFLDVDDYDAIVRATPAKFTGAHIKEAVIYSAMLAIDKGMFEGDEMYVNEDTLLRAIQVVSKAGNLAERQVGFGH